MAEKYSLKDDLFNAETVAYLSGLFQAADPSFDGARFESAVVSRFPELELRQRIDHIADVLVDYLPADFPEAAAFIHKALPPPLDPDLTDNDFGRFIFAPLGEYAVNQGLEAHFDCAMELLYALTTRFSMEFSIRPFLNHSQPVVMAHLDRWATDKHYHVRRLVSEGTRPKLPWGKAITLKPGSALPLLDQLYPDKTRYVTRSVANHLNDIGKTNPELVVDTLKRWAEEGRQDPKELAWMTRHALRSLVKKGDAGALELLGYRQDANVVVTGLEPDRAVLTIGESFDFSCQLCSTTKEALLVDYVIDFVKANGTTAPKVFKLKQFSLNAGEDITLTKKHLFKKGATTFTHYPGVHRLSIQVNGRVLAGFDFTLH